MPGLDYRGMQRALRERALSLVAATTGETSLGASGGRFTRSAGSFLADGFAEGMEIEGLGFSASNSGPRVVRRVTATELVVDPAVVPQAEAGSREIRSGLPGHRVWENDRSEEAKQGHPYVLEQFIPGPTRQRSVGRGGSLQADALYSLQVHVPEDTGVHGANQYADAILRHYTPGTPMAMESGDILRVRTDTGPFRGQLIRRTAGWATVPVTIPVRAWPANNY